VDENNKQLYSDRNKRIADAIDLKVPDRVPVTASFYFFPARYYGSTMQEMMYDPEKLYELHMRVIREFEPDVAQNPFGQLFLGPILDTLDYRQMQWPGRQLEADVPYQFVEGEYMKADEYECLFSDPMDFVVRRYWPRISGELEGLARLLPFADFTSYMSHRSFGIFNHPEVIRAFEAILKAGKEAVRMADYSRRFIKSLEEEGFPSQGGGGTTAPFDFLGDTLRGTKGLMLDMYRRPETVIKACEFLLPILVARGVNSGKASRTGLVFIPLHKGLDGFMSGEQFDRFYWPTLKELIVSLVREGLRPYLFWEGNCTSRLEKIKDIPEGKAVYRFEATDVMRAKEILRGRVCIWGSVPVSLLTTGTPEDVKACCKKLIDHVGDDGGFIMDASAHLTDAKPENVRAMFNFTKEYGMY
jgi:uroporphyrinogen-III decarboxylase